jgi:phosphatidylglycerophosphatase A
MATLALPGWQINAALALLGAAFAIGCVRFGAAAERVYGKKDPGRVVADEVAGQSLTLLFLPWPAGAAGRAALIAAIAFLFFRICDIAKPWPAHRLQRLTGGWGILIDDLVAGVYAALATQVVVRIAF